MESKTGVRKFDLNVEKILEDWEVHHGIREIIANAIDEEVLTDCKPMEISKDREGGWHFRDFGRGLKYEHLTQKESDEKLKNSHVIGKFGIGLKDALATFDRRKIKVFIKSRHGEMTLGKSEKHGFEDLITLHAYIRPPSDPKFVGTEFVLKGCTAGADLKRYYELVLTDGLNLRHDIVHGLLDPKLMTKSTVELIIHLLLTLTRFKVS